MKSDDNKSKEGSAKVKSDLSLTAIEPIAPRRVNEFEDKQETRFQLMREYVGGKNRSYYMSAFHRFDDSPYLPRTSFNLSAFTFGIFWMCYRKMYAFSLFLAPCLMLLYIYVAFPFLATYHTSDYFWLLNPAIDLAILIGLVLTALSIGFFGNYLYYRHVSFKVWRAQKRHPTVMAQRKHLTKSGMFSKTAPVVAFLLLFSAAIPTFYYLQDYVTVARKQLRPGLELLDAAGRSVSDHMLAQGEWLTQVENTVGISKLAADSLIEEISLNRQLIVVTFKGGNAVLPEFRGKSLAYFGYLNESSRKIRWRCGSVDMQLLHLPGYCKQYLLNELKAF